MINLAAHAARLATLGIIVGLAALAASGVAQAGSSPRNLELTNPAQVNSATTVRPIPVDDLFFTRSVGGPAWSPDGKEIVFYRYLKPR